ncbi:MAG: hypothetical protein DRP01_01205 [Archaeoglobales archaeon]|nr:MAG: hypothetical protein DRP01_01205 [Archaeoglobales archaeon]
MTNGQQEEKGILDSIIDAIAGLYEALGVSEEDAKTYATWTFWGIVAIVVIVIALKLYKLIRGY